MGIKIRLYALSIVFSLMVAAGLPISPAHSIGEQCAKKAVKRFMMIDFDMEFKAMATIVAHGDLKKGESVKLPFTLMSGNHYVFIAVGCGSSDIIAVEILDEGGKQAASKKPGRDVAAVDLKPATTGKFTLVVRMEGATGPSSGWALGKTYK